MKRLVIAALASALLVTTASAEEKITRYGIQNPNSLEILMNAINTNINNIRDYLTYGAMGNPSIGINSNFDLKNDNAFDYTINGEVYTQTADQNWDTGTAAAIPANRWGVVLLSVGAETAKGDTDQTRTATWKTNSSTGYATEAAAIAARAPVPANHANVGYVTVRAFTVANGTSSADTWDAGTDALTSGSGGTAAQNTNYYTNPYKEITDETKVVSGRR